MRSGVGHVLVNGTEIVRDGAFTGAVPGRVLRSGRDTDTVHAGSDWAGAGLSPRGPCDARTAPVQRRAALSAPLTLNERVW